MRIGANCAIDYTRTILADRPSPVPPGSDQIRAMSRLWSLFHTGSGYAAKSPIFAPVFKAREEQDRTRDEIMQDAQPVMGGLIALAPERHDAVNAALEWLRLSNSVIPDNGRRFVVRTKEITVPMPNGGERTLKPVNYRPGDTISLTREETELLLDYQDLMRSRWDWMGRSVLAPFGYDGAWDADEVRAWAAEQSDNIRDSVMALYEAIEAQRVKGYAPLMRGGDVMVTVRGPDGKVDTGGFFMFNSNAWMKDTVGPRLAKKLPEFNLNREMAKLRERFPASEGYTIEPPTRLRSARDTLKIEDLSALDRLFTLMNDRSEEVLGQEMRSVLAGVIDDVTMSEELRPYAVQIMNGALKKLPDRIKSILLKDIVAGFTKQSRLIAGYDPNIAGRSLDYFRMHASTVSRRLMRPKIDAAMETFEERATPVERGWVRDWMNYSDKPESALWRGARAIGFFEMMWGSLASGFVNGFATWTVTAPQMSVMKASAGGDIYKVSAQIMKAFRGDLGHGMFIDIDRIAGLSPDERAALKKAQKRRVVTAHLTREMMGAEATLIPETKNPFGQHISNLLRVGGSVVTVFEELSKYAAFIVAYRYAGDRAAMKNWRDAYGSNELAKLIDPSDRFQVAEFMTDTVTFRGGQLEKPPIMRNAGGVIFQFSQWPLQLSKLLYQNFAKQGPRGRNAALFTVSAMWLVSGVLYGIPFGDDAINIFEWIAEKIAGEKYDFRNEYQQMLAEYLADERAAEAIMHGPLRGILGIDVSRRIGFSSFLPESSFGLDAIPAMAGTVGRVGEYYERMANGQPIAAYTALVSTIMGKGTTDVMKAVMVYPEEGYRAKGTANPIVKAEDITAGDMLARSLGFQSAHLARMANGVRVKQEIAYGTQKAEANLKKRLAIHLAKAIEAEERGDARSATRERAKFEAELQEAVAKMQARIEGAAGGTEKDQAKALARIVRVPSSAALREAVIEELYPEMAIEDAGKFKRQAIIDARNDLLATEDDDLFADDE